MLDEFGNRIMQVLYCPKCEKYKGYISNGTILGKCLKCGSIINYTFEKIEDKKVDDPPKIAGRYTQRALGGNKIK